MAGTDASIDVQGGAAYAFEVFSAFREHARFLRGIESVERRGNRLHVAGRVGARREEWEADVVAEEPGRRLAWRAPDGPLDVEVTFEELDGGRSTRVRVRQRLHDAGSVAGALGALRVLQIQARGDLKRYKAVVEGGTAVGMSW